MPLVRIFHTSFNAPLEDQLTTHYLNQLNPGMAAKILSYLKWEDRQRSLLGKMLLKKGLDALSIYSGDLSQVLSTSYGRLYINEDVSFNISHAGNRVICAISSETILGVDIEQIKPITFSDFQNTMTDSQWIQINTSRDQLTEFYRFWTMKESAIKADGRGLSLELDKLEINDGAILLENNLWHLYSISIDRDYDACLAAANRNLIIDLNYIEPFNL